VEGATITSSVTEGSTMLVIGLFLSMFGIGLFCWLIFTLAVYALPFFIGLTAGGAAFHIGAGLLGALLVGIVTGALALAIGQIAFAVAHPPMLRAVIAAAFAIPAAVAGYHAVLGLAQIDVLACLARSVRLDRGALHRRHGLGSDDSVRGAPSVATGRSLAEQLSAGSHCRYAKRLGLRRLAKGCSGDRAQADHVLRSQGGSSLRRRASSVRSRLIAYR
jgi:hypothetical protein